MTNFTVCTLASSSKGNSIYVRMGEDEILIDVGISAKRTADALRLVGSDISRIKAIFITHEHSDHTSGLEIVAKKYNIPIHITEPSARVLLCQKTEHVAKVAVIHPILYTEAVGGITVTSFVTSHDSAASVGYVIRDGNTGHTLAVATDLGYVSDDVSDALIGVQNIILESNHDENMLLCGPYDYTLKRRILSPTGHLSNDAAAAFVSRLAVSGTKRILLAHLSEENNLPEIAYHTSLEAIAGKDVVLAVAKPGEPTVFIGEDKILPLSP